MRCFISNLLKMNLKKANNLKIIIQFVCYIQYKLITVKNYIIKLNKILYY